MGFASTSSLVTLTVKRVEVTLSFINLRWVHQFNHAMIALAEEEINAKVVTKSAYFERVMFKLMDVRCTKKYTEEASYYGQKMGRA